MIAKEPMKLTIDQIDSAMHDEAQKHLLDMATIRVDVPAIIATNMDQGFQHQVRCICGETIEVKTADSAQTLKGNAAIQTEIGAQYARHFRRAMARMIFELYEPTQ